MKMYRLENRVPVPIVPEDYAALGRAMMEPDRRVGQTEKGDVKVSTVFLALDHRFNDQGPPLLFETMIFGGEHDGYQDRCSTWEQAEVMHKVACDMAFGIPDAAHSQTKEGS